MAMSNPYENKDMKTIYHIIIMTWQKYLTKWKVQIVATCP